MPISRIGGRKDTTFLLNGKALWMVIAKINKK